MTEHPFQHRPVMIEEILTLFEDIPSGTMVDATLGGAGHAEALLEAHPGNSLLGIDRDPAALAAASARLARFGDRVHLVHARFDQLAELMTDLSLAPASSVLFDLGVSSPQLDVAERGFSYRAAGPVDGRFQALPARDDGVARGPGAERGDLGGGVGEDRLGDSRCRNGHEAGTADAPYPRSPEQDDGGDEGGDDQGEDQ